MVLKIVNYADIKNTVNELNYKLFMNITNLGKKYILIDLLSSLSSPEGYLEDAMLVSFNIIDEETKEEFISKKDYIVVYFGIFQCITSIEMAKKVSELDDCVVDYKEWFKDCQEKRA